MEFRILGPLEALDSTGQPRPLERRQARLLAMLLLAADRVVPREQLLEAIWDVEPPVTAAQQLKNLVSALRRKLSGGGGGVVIDCTGPGYRIRLTNARLDRLAFAEQLVTAQSTLANGDLAGAVRELRSGLAVWRGPALAGLTSHGILAAAARLDEERLTALEQCVDLELRLGNHHQLVGELTELVATHPLRERLVGQLMLALHRNGRSADALAAYHQLRTRLADELGVEPTATLLDTYTAILRQDDAGAPSGQPAAVLATTASSGIAIPRQLPAASRHFVGRVAELNMLTELAEEAAAPRCGSVVVAAITGTGGVGKTALALQAAHRLADRFPDGQLYLNLRGYDPTGTPMAPDEAIRALLGALHVPQERLPGSVDLLAGLYRSLMTGRRMLIVLDNARDVDHIRLLLPGAAGCLVVVTSRAQLTGLVASTGAQPVILDLLTSVEARDLLASQLGAERLDNDAETVEHIISLCARLPLGLAIVAARAAEVPSVPLRTFAVELANAHSRLDVLDTRDPFTDLRGVFSWSYQRLGNRAGRLFRLLGLHPGPHITTPSAASLAGTPLAATWATLAELTHAHLLSEHSPGRYTLHDLLREYAVELGRDATSDLDERESRRRLLDYYLHAAHAADVQLPQQRERTVVPAGPRPGVISESCHDARSAMAWFDAEHPVLLAAVTQAASTAFHTHAWQLAWFLTPFLQRRGDWRGWAEILRTALRSAHQLGDAAAQAHAHRGLAAAYIRLGRHEEADAELDRAITLYRHTGDQFGEAYAHRLRGLIFNQQGQLRQQIDESQRALELYQAGGHRAAEASAMADIGWGYTCLGEHQRALEICRQALELLQESGNRTGEAAAWHSLGRAHHHLDQHRQAIDCYQRSLAIVENLDMRYDQGVVLDHLGDTYHATGDDRAAHDAWWQAVTILDRLHHDDAERVRGKLAPAAASLLSTKGFTTWPAA